MVGVDRQESGCVDIQVRRDTSWTITYALASTTGVITRVVALAISVLENNVGPATLNIQSLAVASAAWKIADSRIR